MLIPRKNYTPLTVQYGSVDITVGTDASYRGAIDGSFGTVANDTMLRVNGVVKPVIWCISTLSTTQAYIEFDFSDNALANAVMERILQDWSSVEDSAQTHWGGQISGNISVDGGTNNIVIYDTTEINAWDSGNDTNTYTVQWF